MTTLGRQMRVLGIAAALSVDDAAVAADLAPGRIRAIESGLGDLGYLEGLTLAKAYQLCASCFAKHVRLAAARDDAADAGEEPSDAA